MDQTKLLANRIQEVFINGKWIANTNYKDQLSELNWEQATKKIGALNTIAALTFHVNYYIGGILNFLENGKLEIKDKYSFDMPLITTERDWKKLRHSLMQNAEKFAQLVEVWPDEKLDEVFVLPKYGTYQRNIEGLIEHSYYHLGQISLINKLIKTHFKL